MSAMEDVLGKHRPVLEAVGRYRLMLPESWARFTIRKLPKVTEKVRADERSRAGTALRKLTECGLLNHHCPGTTEFPPFPGDVGYFSLTAEGAKVAKVPQERAVIPGKRALKESALEGHLACLWFCTERLDSGNRTEPDELEPLIGRHKSLQNVPHCLVKERGEIRLYRLYPAATDLKRILQAVRRQVSNARDLEELRTWIDERDYAFAILAGSKEYCREIQRAVKSAGLTDEAHIVVALTPTPATLRMHLKSSRGPDHDT